MAKMSLTLGVRKRWFFYPAALAGVIAMGLGLIRDVPSDEHVGGVMPALDRVVRWLARHAVQCEVA